MNVGLGILLVTLAGLGTGTIAWPMKLIKKLQFEHYWFLGMLFGLLIIPWIVVLTCIPHPFQAYAEVGWRPLLFANLFAVGWGVANVLYGICVVRIGAALTGAILSGLGISVGAILPLALKGSGLFGEAPDLMSRAGLMVLGGVAVILVGILFCTLAGFNRGRMLRKMETTDRQASGDFMGGLVLVVLAGVLSSGIGLCFVYGQGPILKAVSAQDVGLIPANMAVWAAALLGGTLVNLIYPAYLMTQRKSWPMLFGSIKEIVLAITIGVQFMIAIMMLGRGMVLLGAQGGSIGFGMQQAMQIMGNQGVGFVSGEWRGISGKPRLQMVVALCILILGVVIMAFVNTMD